MFNVDSEVCSVISSDCMCVCGGGGGGGGGREGVSLVSGEGSYVKLVMLQLW